jgi:hypothetical protein
MFKRLIQIVCISLLLASNYAIALTCANQSPTDIVDNNETIFVAFILEGHFVEGENADDCGWVEGSFKIVQELKGNAQAVNKIRMRLTKCNAEVGTLIGGPSDRFPIGKFMLIATSEESDSIDIGPCSPVWDDLGSCVVDKIQRELGVAPEDLEVREWCIGNEGDIENLRSYIHLLERELKSNAVYLEELKEELAEAKEELAEAESNEIER